MEENEENKNCECTNCKCKTLSKAKDMLEQKRKAVSGGEVVQKSPTVKNNLLDLGVIDSLTKQIDQSDKSHSYIEIVQFLKP
jgi:hypothetical protein